MLTHMTGRFLPMPEKNPEKTDDVIGPNEPKQRMLKYADSSACTAGSCPTALKISDEKSPADATMTLPASAR